MKNPFKSTKGGNGEFFAEDYVDAGNGSVGLSEIDDEESVRGLCDLYCPDPDSGPDTVCETNVVHLRDVADTLIESGHLREDVYKQLRQSQASDPSIESGEWLLAQHAVSEEVLLTAKASLYGMTYQRFAPGDIDAEAFDKLDIGFIENSQIMPVRFEDGVLLLATAEPGNAFALEDARRQVRMDTRVVVCAPQDIQDILHSTGEVEEEVDYNIDEIISDMTEVEVVQDTQDDGEDLERMAGQSPVIKFVNFLISNAIREGASDIHIEPKEKVTRIRYRIDGVLFEVKQAPSKMHPAITSRVKIMANLDISERRLPQDGKISVMVGGRKVDLRVSTLPTSHGEKTVIRVLDSQSIIRGLEELGMETNVCETFREQVALPHGVFLVTGPTGSGKSTTLYSALRQMDGDRLNVSTVEDPVEYQLDFCNQVQVRETIGMTFGAALRSLLRQDPDIIMVGEIRDTETARIAIQAALTGHLVLSTLHTNDAPSSITRMVNIGIDPYLIAAALNGVLAQRLVRKICSKCKAPWDVPENMGRYIERSGISSDHLVFGAGCDNCRGSGYSGRLGIYELMVIDDKFRDMINMDSSVSNMRRAFQASGLPALFDDGMKKVERGLTTVEEVLRVTEVYGITADEEFVENS
jgi:type IV pilus assembly protein PilB